MQVALISDEHYPHPGTSELGGTVRRDDGLAGPRRPQHAHGLARGGRLDDLQLLGCELDLPLGELPHVDQRDIHGVPVTRNHRAAGDEGRQDQIEPVRWHALPCRREPVRAYSPHRGAEIGNLRPVDDDGRGRLGAEVSVRGSVGEYHCVPEGNATKSRPVDDVVPEVIPVPHRLGERTPVHRRALAVRKGEPAAVLDFVVAPFDLKHDQALALMGQDEIRLAVAGRVPAVARRDELQPVHHHPVVAELLQPVEHALLRDRDASPQGIRVKARHVTTRSWRPATTLKAS